MRPQRARCPHPRTRWVAATLRYLAHRFGDCTRRNGDRRVRAGRRQGTRRSREPTQSRAGQQSRRSKRFRTPSSDADRGRLRANGARLHRLSRAAQAPPRRGQTLVNVSARSTSTWSSGLARERQREPGLLAGRADPQRRGQGDRELLAQPRLSAAKWARRIARATSTSTTSTCCPATARAGRCARSWPRASTACPARSSPAPPKHFSSAVGQIVNFLGTLQNEWAGAQAFSSFDTYMAPFVRKDGLGYDEVRQCIQELVYNLNVPVALGHADAVHQPHVRLDVPRRPARAGAGGRRRGDAVHLRRPADRDGPHQPRVHRGHDDGDAKGRVFTFPIPTYNITKDFDWDIRERERLFAMTAKYGLPYFQNFLNSRSRAAHDPLDVLPPAARPARAAEARQRPVRLGRADGFARRGDDELRPAGLRAPRRRGGLLARARRAAATSAARASSSSAR